jgi:hypothetical protein
VETTLVRQRLDDPALGDVREQSQRAIEA